MPSRHHQSNEAELLSRDRCLRVMRPHDTACEAGNTTAEDHSSPACLLHGRNTELRQQKGRPAVRAPCLLEVVDGDVGDGLDAGLAEGGACIVEEDRGRSESGFYGGVETADLQMSVGRREVEVVHEIAGKKEKQWLDIETEMHQADPNTNPLHLRNSPDRLDMP